MSELDEYIRGQKIFINDRINQVVKRKGFSDEEILEIKTQIDSINAKRNYGIDTLFKVMFKLDMKFDINEK
jgi:hypothetical protein